MYDEAAFQAALKKPRLRQPVPEYLNANRGEPIRVIQEHELMAQTERWFEVFQDKLDFYAKLGHDLQWVMDWAKKYWWSWLMRDMDHNHELYTADLKYTDVSSFGNTIVGLDEFVKYNFAFFAAIPDWRYDPLPDQVFMDIKPDGRVSFMIRYIGSGHWDGPLRMYPYADNSPTMHGTGRFIQCPAVDRYHFNADGLMYEGETLYDFIDGAQRAGVLPGGDSWQLKLLFGASKIPATIDDVRRRVGAGVR